ncbi:MAG TPA: GNAT family N-acetyltransferase [Steroidobacter sp.]|uniref:GNAT family N-acetyltransferase n=1 Tax=Steroidobacter sp. TaxID=1978227 RepID=UPI002EDACC78
MIELLSPSTVDATARVLTDHGFSVFGISTTALTRSVCDDAVRENGPVALIARVGDEVRGVAVAIVDAPRYWKKFMFRHPLFACRVLGKRNKSSRNDAERLAAGVDAEGDAAAFAVNWNESSPHVARVSLIVVSSSSRGCGLGAEMYEAMFDHLRARGVVTVLARIGAANTASLQLHRKTGWTLGRRGARWQALKEL